MYFTLVQYLRERVDSVVSSPALPGIEARMRSTLVRTL